MFQDSEIILREKIFSEIQTNLSPGIAMRFQRQKLPFTCNQRRRTLAVRIPWKGDWISCVLLRCESASQGEKFWGTVSLRHSLLGQEVSGAELRAAGRHWGNIPGAELRAAGRHWGNIPGAELRGAGRH